MAASLKDVKWVEKKVATMAVKWILQKAKWLVAITVL